MFGRSSQSRTGQTMNHRCAGADSSGSAGAQAPGNDNRAQSMRRQRYVNPVVIPKCINTSAPPKGRPRLCRCCSRALQFPKAVPHGAAPCHDPHTPSSFDPVRAALLAHIKRLLPQLCVLDTHTGGCPPPSAASKPYHYPDKNPPGPHVYRLFHSTASSAYSAAQVTLQLP